ncbi:MAG: phosphate acyltransferase PlsX [Lachnospiraceae bacterium]|nr:phosphate acyltransferase PlsX [Candidatus Minthocola equi]
MIDGKVVIALDAMGGDNAPKEIVEGALLAASASNELKILLVGGETEINECLAGRTSENIEIVPTTEVIETGEPPVAAVRHKKDSSLVVGERLVAEQKADAFVSAGSSGAVLVGGQLIVGRLKGVDRAPIGAVIPTAANPTLIIDSGANMDCRAGQLVQFAIMGSIYMQQVMGLPNPRVAIANVGLEEEKGNAHVKETFPLLKACDKINFIGSIEAREIPHGGADVVVCDAFVGNVILKLYEGTASALLGMVKKGLMSTLRSKIGGLLIKPALKQTLKGLSVSDYGGAPLLGLKGLVVKTHGSATRGEVSNTLIQCIDFVKQDLVGKIADSLTATDINKED